MKNSHNGFSDRLFSRGNLGSEDPQGLHDYSIVLSMMSNQQKSIRATPLPSEGGDIAFFKQQVQTLEKVYAQRFKA